MVKGDREAGTLAGTGRRAAVVAGTDLVVWRASLVVVGDDRLCERASWVVDMLGRMQVYSAVRGQVYSAVRLQSFDHIEHPMWWRAANN